MTHQTGVQKVPKVEVGDGIVPKTQRPDYGLLNLLILRRLQDFENGNESGNVDRLFVQERSFKGFSERAHASI